MENASKALIIAGAILLSILIIGLGMAVFNSSKSVTGSINLDSQELGAHNSQFLAYEGRQKGSQVSTLLTMIQSNNNEYDDRQITVCLSSSSSAPKSFDSNVMKNESSAFYYDNSSSSITELRKKLKSSTTYDVSFDYTGNGLIVYCGIKVYNSTGNTI